MIEFAAPSSTPCLIGTRTTRDGRPLERLLELDLATASRLAEEGRGVFIGGGAPAQLQRHLVRAVSNLDSVSSIIGTHSYEVADEITDSLRDEGVDSRFIDVDGRASIDDATRAVVAVPERLGALREMLESGRFTPRIAFLLDPLAQMVGLQKHGTYGGRRIDRLVELVAMARAKRAPMLVVIMTTHQPDSLYANRIPEALGLDGLLFVSGSRLRTAACRQWSYSQHEPVRNHALHWLDQPVDAAWSTRGVVIVRARSGIDASDSLRELAELRGHPIIDVGQEGPQLSTRRQLARFITERAESLNRRVVLVDGLKSIRSRIGDATVLEILRRDPTSAVLVAAMARIARDLPIDDPGTRAVRPIAFVAPTRRRDRSD